MNLNDLRQEIDDIDEKFVQLLLRRFSIAGDVAAYKKEAGLPVLDAEREKEVIAKASEAVKDEAYRAPVEELFRTLLSESRSIQERIIRAEERKTVKTAPDGEAAYCGIPGSYAEEAAMAYFGGGTILSPQDTFNDVAKSVLNGYTAYGILPVENSSSGAVAAVEDILYKNDVFITGEWILPIRHHLLGISGASEADIKTVASHQQGIDQCSKYIAENGLAVRLSGNTAFAARDVAKEGDKSIAAIASERAASFYGLNILRRNIQNSADNYTRFVIIEKAPVEDGDKISIVCVLPHTPGSLYSVLSVFAGHGLNLLKLLARPIPESAWHYRFHFDVGGNLRDENVKKAIAEAGAICEDFKVTGCYRAAVKP